MMLGFLLIVFNLILSIDIVSADINFNTEIKNELLAWIGEREISVKIGVLQAAGRGKDHFWIEFDPQVAFQKSANNVILPFVVVANESISKIPFYVNKNQPGCSSVNRPSNKYNSAADLREDFSKSCHDLEKEVKENPSKMSFTLWDDPSSNADSTIKIALDGSSKCYLRSMYELSDPFPAITLNHVLNQLTDKKIHVLDIDSQGSDFELLLSIAKHLPRVKHVRIECQSGMYMYETYIPNNCNAAKVFLESLDFTLDKVEVNNCGIQEFNLLMTRRAH